MRKRFYRSAGVEKRGETYLVVLDGKPAKTPRGRHLAAPTRALAEAIAEEWNRQGEGIITVDMQLTAFAASAIDRVSAHRRDVIEHALGFGRGDLVCYRADDPKLAARQAALWDPVLGWAVEMYGLRLVSDVGVTYIEQPADSLVRMQEIVSGFDDFTLAAFDAAAALTGSFVLALALIDDRFDADAAFAAAYADELYQAKTWGIDAEAESRRRGLLAELRASERVVRLLR